MQAELAEGSRQAAERQARRAAEVAQAANIIASDEGVQAAVEDLFQTLARQQVVLIKVGTREGLDIEDSAALADRFSAIYLNGLRRAATAVFNGGQGQLL